MRDTLITFALCISVIAVLPSRSTAQAELRKAECSVYGTAFNLERAVWPNAEVTYSNSTSRSVAFTNEDGDYKLQLPPGLYDLTVTVGFSTPYFHRSKVVHVCPEALNINLWIHPWCASGCNDHAFSKTLGS